jgi:hypothetical protein
MFILFILEDEFIIIYIDEQVQQIIQKRIEIKDETDERLLSFISFLNSHILVAASTQFFFSKYIYLIFINMLYFYYLNINKIEKCSYTHTRMTLKHCSKEYL